MLKRTEKTLKTTKTHHKPTVAERELDWRNAPALGADINPECAYSF